MSNYEKLTKEQKEGIENSIKQIGNWSGAYKANRSVLFAFFIKGIAIAFGLIYIILFFLKLKTFI